MLPDALLSRVERTMLLAIPRMTLLASVCGVRKMTDAGLPVDPDVIPGNAALMCRSELADDDAAN